MSDFFERKKISAFNLLLLHSSCFLGLETVCYMAACIKNFKCYFAFDL